MECKVCSAIIVLVVPYNMGAPALPALRPSRVIGEICRFAADALAPRWRVELYQRPLEIVKQAVEGAVDRQQPCNQDIVVTRPSKVGEDLARSCPQPPARSIADHRVSDLFCNCKANPNGLICVRRLARHGHRSRRSLYHHARQNNLAALRNPQEICAFFQGFHLTSGE